MYVCVCVCIYIYIYIYIHTHTHKEFCCLQPVRARVLCVLPMFWDTLFSFAYSETCVRLLQQYSGTVYNHTSVGAFCGLLLLHVGLELELYCVMETKRANCEQVGNKYAAWYMKHKSWVQVRIARLPPYSMHDFLYAFMLYTSLGCRCTLATALFFHALPHHTSSFSACIHAVWLYACMRMCKMLRGHYHFIYVLRCAAVCTSLSMWLCVGACTNAAHIYRPPYQSLHSHVLIQPKHFSFFSNSESE